MVTEQNPHLVPHINSWKFKRANLAVTRANLQPLVLSESLIFECNSNSSFFLIPAFGSSKEPWFRVAENSEKKGFQVRENPGWKH